MMVSPAASFAEKSYLTVSELRDQAQGRWTQTVETQWRDVDIDAEIVLPDVDAVPVVTVGFDTGRAWPEAEGSGWDNAELREDGSLVLYNDEKTVPKKVDGKRINNMQEAKGAWYAGFAPENTYVPLCAVSFGEICARINGELARFGYDPDDFAVGRPSRLWAQHWYYYGKKKDALPGQIFLQACQNVEGIPLLCHIWSAVCDHAGGESRRDEYFEIPYGNLTACYDGYAGGLTSLFISAEKVVETLARDVPLCPLDAVKAAVTEGIRAGHIRKVYELQFGYAMYNEPGVYREKNDETVPYDTLRYYLKPVWMVNCLYVNSATGKLRTYSVNENDGDERNSLDYRQLLVDAQTGELVNESSAKDRCEYRGFLGWEAVNGR